MNQPLPKVTNKSSKNRESYKGRVEDVCKEYLFASPIPPPPPRDGLKDKCPLWLTYLITWSSFGDTIWGEVMELLTRAGLMEEVHHKGVSFGIFIALLLLLPACR